MRISDWSSDVCSADLLQRQPPGLGSAAATQADAAAGAPAAGHADGADDDVAAAAGAAVLRKLRRRLRHPALPGRHAGAGTARAPAAGLAGQVLERKSHVEGKSVSVRVDLGGRRSIQTKRKHKETHHTKEL